MPSKKQSNTACQTVVVRTTTFNVYQSITSPQSRCTVYRPYDQHHVLKLNDERGKDNLKKNPPQPIVPMIGYVTIVPWFSNLRESINMHCCLRLQEQSCQRKQPCFQIPHCLQVQRLWQLLSTHYSPWQKCRSTLYHDSHSKTQQA